MSWHQEGPSPPNNLKYQISKRKPQIPHRALHLSNVHVNRNLTNHQILVTPVADVSRGFGSGILGITLIETWFFGRNRRDELVADHIGSQLPGLAFPCHTTLTDLHTRSRARPIVAGKKSANGPKVLAIERDGGCG